MTKINGYFIVINMKLSKALFQLGKIRIKEHEKVKSEFIQFVGDQFKQLNRKNLGLPMKLYQL